METFLGYISKKDRLINLSNDTTVYDYDMKKKQCIVCLRCFRQRAIFVVDILPYLIFQIMYTTAMPVIIAAIFDFQFFFRDFSYLA